MSFCRTVQVMQFFQKPIKAESKVFDFLWPAVASWQFILGLSVH